MEFRMEKGKFCAIIPARSGSKGIKDKNIIGLHGYPLMAYSIAAARMTARIDRIIVSTDSEEYANLAISYGAEVPFLRPSEISGSDSKDIEYLEYTIREMGKREDKVPEYVVLLRPTTPVRDVQMILKAMEEIVHRPECDSVVSVHRRKSCPYKWVIMDEKGMIRSPFPDMQLDDVNLPRQSFPLVYEPDGYVDVLRSEVILNKRKQYGDAAYALNLDEDIVDIDTLEDLDKINLEMLECSPLFVFLNKIKS